MIEFMPSGPPPGSGLHRYIVLAFEQSSSLSNVSPPSSRGSFKIKQFASENSLTRPVAINYYFTEKINAE